MIDLIVHLDRHLLVLIQQYGLWVYGILFAIIFTETGFVVALFLPGDSLLFVVGALAAAGNMDPWAVAITLLVAALCGDNVNYWIGRGIGPRVFRWENSRLFNRKAFDKTHSFFEHHGGKTIILARFMPLVRTFSPFVAGVAKMDYRRFLPLDLLGGGLWIFSLTLAGYWFGNQPWIKQNLSVVIFGIIGVSLLPLAVGYLRGQLARRAQA